MEGYFLGEAVLIAGFLAVIGFALTPYSTVAALILLTLSVGLLFFYRNPSRTPPAADNAIVSPADGRVVGISKIGFVDFLGSEAVKVDIFLSLFDVHMNRSPIDGSISHVEYQGGSKFPAFLKRASRLNERNTVGIDGKIRVLVTQISGFVCRRIVMWKTVGEEVAKGERFGMIKFGSRTEIIMPASVNVKVKFGSKVKAGETIVGEIQ